VHGERLGLLIARGPGGGRAREEEFNKRVGIDAGLLSHLDEDRLMQPRDWSAGPVSCLENKRYVK
jgi:hypothetical protein